MRNTSRKIRCCLLTVLSSSVLFLLFSLMYMDWYGPQMLKKDYLGYVGHRANPGEETDSYDELLSMYLKQLKDLRIDGRNFRNSTCSDNPANAVPCFKKDCNASFPPPYQRLRNIVQSRYPITAEHIASIGNLSEQAQSIDITFVVAGSSNHFRESQGVLKDLYEKVFPFLKEHTRFSFRLVYYDLGLKQTQLSVLKKYCNCSVIAFPFDAFPESFRLLGTCIWKPVLVKAHLHRSNFVMWMDASTRFRNGNVTAILRHADKRGLYVSRNGWMLPQHVAQPMMDYFRVEPCLLSPFFELAGGFLVFKRNLLVERAILDPWLSCAFSPNCLCPGKDCLKMKSSCHNPSKPYSRCHRFDQSALAVILVTLFDYRVSSLVAVDFRRNAYFKWGDQVDFFPSER